MAAILLLQLEHEITVVNVSCVSTTSGASVIFTLLEQTNVLLLVPQSPRFPLQVIDEPLMFSLMHMFHHYERWTVGIVLEDTHHVADSYYIEKQILILLEAKVIFIGKHRKRCPLIPTD
jgi:hypothetical protein